MVTSAPAISRSDKSASRCGWMACMLIGACSGARSVSVTDSLTLPP